MTTELGTITVPQNSETAKLLERAARTPLLVEANGVRYRVTREVEDPFANYDPERAVAALRASAGAFAGMDVEAFKAEIREQRAQDSQGRPDPWRT